MIPTTTPTTETPPKMTYETWYNDSIDQANKKAQEIYNASVNNARLSYEQALGNYGANAERLASMGLSNGGYSDYLKTKAYDTYRNEVSAAEKLRSDTIADAKLTYGEMLLGKQETQKTNDLSSYVINAGNGLYTSDQIEEIITNNGYTGADADAIRGAYKKYENGSNIKISEISDDIASGNFANWNALSKHATAAGLDPETFKDEYLDYIVETVNYYGATVPTNYLDELKNFDPTRYEEVKAKYISSIDTSSNAFLDDNGQYISDTYAKQALDSITNNPHISQDVKNAFKAQYDKIYGVKSVAVTSINDGDGENLKVRIEDIRSDEDLMFKRIETPIDESTLPSSATDLNNNTVFMCRDRIYIKLDGKYYELKAKNANQQDDWNEIVDYFANSGTEQPSTEQPSTEQPSTEQPTVQLPEAYLKRASTEYLEKEQPSSRIFSNATGDGFMPKEEAKKMLEAIDASDVGPYIKNMYAEIYNEHYSPLIVSSATVEKRDTYYKLSYKKNTSYSYSYSLFVSPGDKVTDETIHNIAKNVKEPDIFKLNGKFYIKADGYIFTVESKDKYMNNAFENEDVKTSYVD